MKVLFLVLYPTSAPSPRYRVYQLVPWLEAHGVQCDVVPKISPEDFRRSRRGGDCLWMPKVVSAAFAQLGDSRLLR